MKGEPVPGGKEKGDRRRPSKEVNTRVCVYLRDFTQRVYTLANTHRLWCTKAPGKRKDVVKKTTGRGAGDAARSSSHRRRYYTRYDGKLALTVSATDFRLAPVGDCTPAPMFVRNIGFRKPEEIICEK